jgi:hypothetical protein
MEKARPFREVFPLPWPEDQDDVQGPPSCRERATSTARGPGGIVGGMATAGQIGYREVRELLAAGAQLVEVLPEAEYAEEHLPGAVNIPLKALDAGSAARLDRTRAVVVYCWDGL